MKVKKKEEISLEDIKDFVMNIVVKKIFHFRREMKRKMSYLLIMIIALIFTLIGVAKFLTLFLNISEAISFLAVGIVLLIAGLIYRAGTK